MKKKYLVNIYFLFFFIFPAAGNKKNNNNNEKKIILGIIVFGLLPNYIEIFFFIAIQFLYCREKEN